MLKSVRNRVASGGNDATVMPPETATAPRREPQSRLYSTNVVVATPKHVTACRTYFGDGGPRTQEACLP